MLAFTRFFFCFWVLVVFFLGVFYKPVLRTSGDVWYNFWPYYDRPVEGIHGLGPSLGKADCGGLVLEWDSGGMRGVLEWDLAWLWLSWVF